MILGSNRRTEQMGKEQRRKDQRRKYHKEEAEEGITWWGKSREKYDTRKKQRRE